MSIGYYTPGAYGSDAACAEIEARARDASEAAKRREAAEKAAHEEMIAAIRRGENGGHCPLLAKERFYSVWLPRHTDSFGRPTEKGMTQNEAAANGAAAWAVENVQAPYYLDAAGWFDAVARVAGGDTKGMPGGKRSAKEAAAAAIRLYQETVQEGKPAAIPSGEAGSEVVIPSGPFAGLKGVLTAARTATVIIFGRPQVATW